MSKNSIPLYEATSGLYNGWIFAIRELREDQFIDVALIMDNKGNMVREVDFDRHNLILKKNIKKLHRNSTKYKIGKGYALFLGL